MVSPGTAMVEFVDVTKRFGTRRDQPPALSGIDLTIRPQEIFGVIGESGAGKTTMLELINGLVAADEGQVLVEGAPVAGRTRREMRALRRDIGVVFQGIHLLSGRTVRQNIALGLELARGSEANRRTRAQERAAVDEILAFVGLAHRADHYPAELSGGEQQRVGIARALVTRPPLLLCDEPTSSLDARTRAEILRVLSAARDTLGTTIVVISHDLDVVKAICDRALLLEGGRMRELFTVKKADLREMPSYHEQVKRELM
ncbi:D-methionine transport system ATP-binding protein [Microbacterium ginsengiterrae]|uniref:D-methionine transport system ATP-binding protein n=1 Tax=Microbacterium ginsengiterrae TaxID=546115 RepID=A0A7W9FDA1_9MICO|nr:ATP-binding cassette domain-containing protein [Microbacterium ginsengiterrae]MBB5743069.1 D-methionine transport system ATP-binding protein [Microbacterium ginsengiterrae]